MVCSHSATGRGNEHELEDRQPHSRTPGGDERRRSEPTHRELSRKRPLATAAGQCPLEGSGKTGWGGRDVLGAMETFSVLKTFQIVAKHTHTPPREPHSSVALSTLTALHKHPPHVFVCLSLLCTLVRVRTGRLLPPTGSCDSCCCEHACAATKGSSVFRLVCRSGISDPVNGTLAVHVPQDGSGVWAFAASAPHLCWPQSGGGGAATPHLPCQALRGALGFQGTPAGSPT